MKPLFQMYSYMVAVLK